MTWSNGTPANPSANPPTPAIASDMERIRDMFGFNTNDRPVLKSAMDWLTINYPDGIVTVQFNLDKADQNYVALEGVYSDQDYALTQADVLAFEISERSTGVEILKQRYMLKIWSALSLDGYFCKDDYLGTYQSATSGRS